jgi:hypothetical protein
MKSQRLLLILTAVNVLLLGYQFLAPRLALAATSGAPGLLRGSGLQIVDARGRVRASIEVVPEDPKVIWKGEPYPETVLLRLVTADGRPNVKLGASRRGAGLVVGGEADPTYVQVLAERGESTVKLVNSRKTERIITP